MLRILHRHQGQGGRHPSRWRRPRRRRWPSCSSKSPKAQLLIEANKRAEEEAARLAAEKAQAADTMSEMEKQAALLEEQKALTELTLQETHAEAEAREADVENGAASACRRSQSRGKAVDEQLDPAVCREERRRKAERGQVGDGEQVAGADRARADAAVGAAAGRRGRGRRSSSRSSRSGQTRRRRRRRWCRR